MSKELLILRHGKSDWSGNVSDYQRPLKGRGSREAGRIGRWLAEKGLVPDHIISSSAERARQTAEIASEAMGFPLEKIQWQESMYMASVNGLLSLIDDVPEDCEKLMIVGHNPGLEELVFHLAGGDIELPDDGKLLPTATVVSFIVSGRWEELASETCRPGFRRRGKN